MKFTKDDLLLYAVTDRAWVGEKSLFEQVEEARSHYGTASGKNDG